MNLLIYAPIAPGMPSNPRSPLSPLNPGRQSEHLPPTSPASQNLSVNFRMLNIYTASYHSLPFSPISPFCPGTPGRPLSPFSPIGPGLPGIPIEYNKIEYL